MQNGHLTKGFGYDSFTSNKKKKTKNEKTKKNERRV